MIRWLSIVFTLAVVAAPSLAHAQLTNEELKYHKLFQDVYEFLKTNVENRAMVRESEGKLPEGKVAYKFRREATMLHLTKDGLSFHYDTIVKISQQNWDVGPDGMKVGEPRNVDRVLVVHTSIGVRKSTGRLAGVSTIQTTSTENWGGVSQLHTLTFAEGKLSVQTRTGLYDDFFAEGGKFYPGASIDTESWYLKDGKLVRDTKTQAYKVDPDTLEMKPNGEPRDSTEVEAGKLPKS